MDALKLVRQRWTKILAVTTLAVSFQFLIVKNLKLNQLYCLKRRHSAVLYISEPAVTTTASTTTTTDHVNEKSNPVEVVKCGQTIDRHLASSGSRLPNIERYLRYYYKFSACYWLAALLKYVLICCLELDYLREQRYIDCYLFGRFLTNARLNDSINYFAVWGSFFLFIWRWLMTRWSHREHRLYCFEFLMYDLDELSSEEPTTTQDYCSADSILQRRDVLVIQQADLDPSAAQFAQQYPRRLNRTTRQWELLSQALTKHWLYSLASLLLIIPVFLAMTVPLLLTRKGFEVTYTGCSSWISDNNASDYYHIYSPYEGDPSIKPSVFLPMRHFNPQNSYHLFRSTFDLAFNLMVYFDALMAFLSASCIAVLVSDDIRFYASELRPRLRRLIVVLRGKDSSLLQTREGDRRLELEIRSLQSTLMDFFNLIGCYTKYASLLTIYTITGWLSYSALVAKWIFTPGGERPKEEWYVLHVFTTFYLLVVVGSFSRARVACRRLYPLITTAACLDGSHGRGRERWLIIFAHFWPRPLYCFSMFGSVELSWLFLLKLLTWLLSSFVVASSFFSVYSAHAHPVNSWPN